MLSCYHATAEQLLFTGLLLVSVLCLLVALSASCSHSCAANSVTGEWIIVKIVENCGRNL